MSVGVEPTCAGRAGVQSRFLWPFGYDIGHMAVPVGVEPTCAERTALRRRPLTVWDWHHRREQDLNP